VLNFNGTAYGLDDARELYQHAVASGLNDPPAMLPDFGIDNGAPVGSQLSQTTLLVGAHESAISRDIGRQDRGEPSFPTFFRQGEPPESFYRLAKIRARGQGSTSVDFHGTELA